MALPQRREPETAATPSSTPAVSPWGGESGYWPGGEVGQMQADLAKRLAEHAYVPAPPAPHERMVRMISTGAGYLALAAGYAGAMLLILR